MTDDQWRTTLDHLKREREALDPHDERARQSVDQLIEDAESHLAASEKDHKTAFGERLSATVQEFEATHPKLTLQLNRIMMQLSGTGV